MASGDRNKRGKPKDLVIHIRVDEENTIAFCGRKSPGITTNLTPSQGPATCLNCLKIYNQNK